MRSVAVIGAGIGAQHCAGYAALPDRFRLHSICDLDEARAAPIADRFGAGYEADFQKVLADPGVDIVDVCLPPHLHYGACVAALEAGKTVVCEKPLVASLAEADALIAKAEETGGQVFPVFQYRFGTGMAQLRALIDAGLAGRCYAGTLETHWDRDAAYYAIDWRGTWAGEQGGAILGHAIHIHDFLPAVLGPVASVYAELATRVNDIEVEDCAAITLRMEEGALVTSSVTLGAADNTSRMRLMFEGFTVESDHAPYAPAAAPWRFLARAPTEQAALDAVLAKVGPQSVGFAGLFAAMADALDGQPNVAVTLADARRSLEFVTAVYHSARAEAPVRLPLGAEHPLFDGWLP
ncbi:Myo-inositol 2-dehydrogenase [Candidatus Rhodobacter oscarellae]|uniref:Myo-inositol 2-dehydrogenase n=1 Tax=Candidatus Rhodobacter oscarellae TaxID=1675527 RepID=A0A0J9H4H5_9RHOB|nr:Gfo/Idh/MocA family oxidoreductase [Candidatus Rhodobacter lobularis]KMW60558.1 Myo-inositol 2-dehydrogenase [Candidatus Rhodobacter lobularis]